MGGWCLLPPVCFIWCRLYPVKKLNNFFLNLIETGDMHVNHSSAISEFPAKCISIVCQHRIAKPVYKKLKML